MSATATKPLAAIDFEVDAVRPLARAEAALDAIGRTNDNPFRGNVDRLAVLEAEREHAALREHGERLLAAINQRAALRAEIARLEDDLRRWTEQLAQFEADPLILRWKRAPMIANAGGRGQHFQTFAQWYLSGGAPNARGSNFWYYAAKDWPEAIVFDCEGERTKIHQWREAEHRAKAVLPPALFEAKRQSEQLESAHPEIRGVP